MNEMKRVPQLCYSNEKKKNTYQVRPPGLVKETLATSIIETYDFDM